MRLYFLRHGVAFEREDWHGENDELRPLTDEGIQAMEREAKKILEMDLKPDFIISSPLVRARQTAKIVASALAMDVEQDALLKPGFDISDLEKLISHYRAAKRLMAVGHEPDFSSVISQLIRGGSIEMAKGGLARVDLADVKKLRGDLIWLLTPKLLGA